MITSFMLNGMSHLSVTSTHLRIITPGRLHADTRLFITRKSSELLFNWLAALAIFNGSSDGIYRIVNVVSIKYLVEQTALVSMLLLFNIHEQNQIWLCYRVRCLVLKINILGELTVFPDQVVCGGSPCISTLV